MNDVLEVLKKLPPECYVKILGEENIVLIKRGVAGYFPVQKTLVSQIQKGKVNLDKLNAGMGCSKAQKQAMLAGSMFGWEIPAADPDKYDSDGRFVT